MYFVHINGSIDGKEFLMKRAEALRVNSHLKEGILAKEPREKKQQKPTWNILYYVASQNLKEILDDSHLLRKLNVHF